MALTIESTQRTRAFLEDLNTKLRTFDTMISQAREDITKELARLEAAATINSTEDTNASNDDSTVSA